MSLLTLDNPDAAPAPLADAYTNVARIELGSAALLVLAGQIALDEDGQLVGEGDMGRQSRQIFETIKALLEAHGAGFADVVNIRTFLTDMRLLEKYGAVRAEYVSTPPPTSTTVEVSKLFRPGALLELEVTAVVRP